MTAAEKLAIISSINRVRDEEQFRQDANGGPVEEFYKRTKDAMNRMLAEVDEAWRELTA